MRALRQSSSQLKPFFVNTTASICASEIHLAPLEIRALLVALAKRVKRFELHSTERCLNNTLRGLSKCEVAVH